MKIGKEVASSFKFLRENRRYLAVIIGLFLVSIEIGYLFPNFFSDIIQRFIEDTVAKTRGLGFWSLFLFILKNNITTALIGTLFGLLFGIVPLFFAFFNGYVLGFVMNKAVDSAGAGVLWRLVPHGIFEIPALVISLGLGLRLGMFFIFSRNRDFGKEIKRIFKTFLIIVVPLLLIAALIETSLMIFLS